MQATGALPALNSMKSRISLSFSLANNFCYVTQVMTGGHRVLLEDTRGLPAGDWRPPGPIRGHHRAARMPSVSSGLVQFVYAVWRAPERAM